MVTVFSQIVDGPQMKKGTGLYLYISPFTNPPMCSWLLC